MELSFKLEKFEGPLDLLLSLIAKNKVEICDIPISLIFDQYMEYIGLMQSMDMEVAGEFIVMASELMLIKSRMLLPREEKDEEEDPRARLAAALIEYKRIKDVSKTLAEKFDTYSRRYVKDTDEIKADAGYVAPHNAEVLADAVTRMLRRIQNAEKEAKEVEVPFEKILRTPIVPVSVKIYSVLHTIRRRGHVTYTSMLESAKSRSELIAIFMSVLELIKNGRLILKPVEISNGSYEDFEMYINTDRKRQKEQAEAD